MTLVTSSEVQPEVAETGAELRRPVPTGHDVPRTVSVLVFLRDRGIFMLWGLLIVVFAFWCSPYFFTVDNALLIANAGALTALFAAGVGIGIMTGVLDLSLPGTAAIASCVCGWLLTHGHATWLSLVAGLGLRGRGRPGQRLHHAARLQPDHRHHRHPVGPDRARSGGGRRLHVPRADPARVHGHPPLPRIGETGETFPGIPAPVFIVAAVFIVGTVFLTRTRDGLRLMAVGANAEAVRRAGIPSTRYNVLGFVISGILAALGGLVNTANVTEANPAASPAIIFTALTAVALAGVALTGGRGSLPRVLVGALILATIANGLIIRGIQPYWATVATGALLLGSLLFERMLQTAVSERLMSANLSVHAEAGLIMTTLHRYPGPGAQRHRGALRLRAGPRRHRHARHAGRGRALLGDNGAGKSTLLKVMSGAHKPSHGTIRVHGVEQSFHAPSDAASAGIQMVYQDLALVEPQDISTNLNMGQEQLRRGRSVGWASSTARRCAAAPRPSWTGSAYAPRR